MATEGVGLELKNVALNEALREHRTQLGGSAPQRSTTKPTCVVARRIVVVVYAVSRSRTPR